MAGKPLAYKHNRLQQLRGFIHAARSQSISRAAEKMFLSQPSVSLQIKALESDFAVQLFQRNGPRIVLTHDGETLLKLAKPLVDGIDRLSETFDSLRETVDRGTVSIAAGGSTIQYILPPFVGAFSREYPNVDIRLRNATGKAGLTALREREVDFAVGPMLDAPPDISFHPFVTYNPVLVTRLDHPLAKRKRITLKDISRYPLILPPKDQSTYRFVESVFTEHSLDYEVKLEVGGYEVIKKYVQLGLGISIVMHHCLTDADRLHCVPVERYFPKRKYGVVVHNGRTLSPAANQFMKSMLAAGETVGRKKG